MARKLKALVAVAGLTVLSACNGLLDSQMDRSFFQQIDAKDWPGDALSERQTNAAVRHFAHVNYCGGHHLWALIGPDTMLLEGTSYLVHRHLNAVVPNIGWSHGYWGGAPTFENSIPTVQALVVSMANDDCRYGSKLIVFNGPDDSRFANDAR